jgi:hypothetical protein
MWVGGQSHAPANLPPGKRPSIHCTGGLVGHGAGLGGYAEFCHYRDLISRPCSEWLYRLPYRYDSTKCYEIFPL